MRHSEIVSEPRSTYTQDSLGEYFTDPKVYKKTGSVDARRAVAGEFIATIIDGEIETTNTASDDDVVVRGPRGEEYILSRVKFQSRYGGPDLSDDYQTYIPTGITYAVEWTHGPGRFKASWGEMMIINDGDYLCSPSIVPEGDLYRIEREAFAITYEEIEDDREDNDDDE